MTRLQHHLLELIKSDPGVVRWGECALSAKGPTEIQGLGGSSAAFAITASTANTKRPTIVVAANNEAAEQCHDDLQHVGWSRLSVFPAWEILPYEDDEPVLEITAKRLDTYALWLEDSGENPPQTPSIAVVTADALLQQVPPPGRLAPRRLKIQWGEPLDLEKLAESLVESGYERLALVESRGEFSIRGNIIDIFPPTAPLPIRIDLFGDEIESIRYFDPLTQRSRSDKPEAEEIVLEPAHETALMAEGDLVPLTTWFPPNARVHFIGADNMGEQGRSFFDLVERQYDEARRKASINEEESPRPPRDLYIPWLDMIETLEGTPLSFQSTLPLNWLRPKQEIDFNIHSFESAKPDFQAHIDVIRTRQREGALAIIACDNNGQVMRLVELMREADIDSCPLYSKDPDQWKPTAAPGGVEPVVLTVGPLHHGFAWRSLNLMVITDRELFGRYRRRHVYRKFHRGATVSMPDEIKRDDYVVHVEHGIGVFRGLRKQRVDGEWRDLLEVEYAEKNLLLVPVEKIRLVQRYSVSENENPQLDKLGSRKWLQRRKKSQKQIREMAEELLRLYAKRAAAEGNACGEDTSMMAEFEASFLYPETPDQAKAIADVKSDLERSRPMDRLVCGDVGYGKTEVAIRAGFKVVQDGRQVAFLCPTTILAQQHTQTLRERFAEYPVRIECLSRFQTMKEQRDTIARAKRGEVDIIVGTHRLLSKDVTFLDLGLLIIDEEQRFGVAHKERLKKFRESIDVLTLTATPIPRTLHMALSGLRDMSLIQTPPEDRLPIKTRIIHWEDDLIAEAVLRELNRGGQIYFVHNRVQNIHGVSAKLQEIVPSARIAIGHGQMSERELEQVFTDFVEGKYDILLATTIIENGLDIPNVNTIIINRADAFGLAQLYQLRGRVGRDVKRAHCYMVVPEGDTITDQAVRRLSTLEEFSELGVGFQIALRDMEIRGTGNLLGGEQHGAMQAIGFDLYCELLDEEIKNLKGEPVAPWRDVEIRWPISAFLPAEFVPIESQRLMLYKRLSVARNLEDVNAVDEELRDRFGRPHIEALALLQVTRLRVLGGALGLTRISSSAKGVHLLGAPWTSVIAPKEALPKGIRRIVVDSPTAAGILMDDLSPIARLGALVELMKRWTDRIREDDTDTR